MPFTFSHPAVVLPCAYFPKKYFSMTGLILGSLTPDFEYFLRMRMKSDFSHTWHGLLWFDLPLGLILSFVFHNIVRDDLINNLPRKLKSRFSTLTTVNWNEYVRRNAWVVTLSILIGSTSHILWDSFTHERGIFAEAIPTLQRSAAVFGMQIPVYKVLQHVSTLVGAGVIAVAVLTLPTIQSVETTTRSNYWFWVTGISLLILALRFATGLKLAQYGNVLSTAISAGCIALTVAPWLCSKSLRPMKP